jgi:DNA-binding GntR family transcriptional regulator
VPSGLAKVQSQTLQARVYEEIRGALIRGHFAPGESVSIRQLAKDLGTSPMPVREAVHRLVSERALEMRGARSLRVPLLTREKFKDLTRVRCLVEPPAAGLAATRISPEQLAVLDRENARLMRAIKKVSLPQMLESNRAFHFTIYEAAGSPILLQVIDSLWLQIGPYLQALFQRYQERLEATGTERVSAELLAAIKKGDAAKARRIRERDIQAAAAWYMQRMGEPR